MLHSLDLIYKSDATTYLLLLHLILQLTNFSVYLEKLRMAKAKELVLESSVSISELYQYTGYNNAASFRRAFKKKFGVSPKEMREKAASGL